MLLSNVIPLSKELALPKTSKRKGWHISQFIESKSLPWALMGLFIGFTYSGVLVFIPIELNSMGAGIWGSAFFCYLCFDDYNQSTFGGESVCSLWI